MQLPNVAPSLPLHNRGLLSNFLQMLSVHQLVAALLLKARLSLSPQYYPLLSSRIAAI